MVALFNDQKKEMEQRLDNAVGSQSEVSQLEAQRLKDKHLIENLRDEIESLKERLKTQQESQQSRAYEPPPAPFLPAAGLRIFLVWFDEVCSTVRHSSSSASSPSPYQSSDQEQRGFVFFVWRAHLPQVSANL